MHPHLDLLDEIVRILGWPALLGAFVWVIRKWDRSTAQFNTLSENTAETKRMAMETLGGIATIRDNHLAHLAEEIKGQTPILTNMDKTLAIISDKLNR